MRASRVTALLGAWWGLAALPQAAAQEVANIDVQPTSLQLAMGERREVLATAFDARSNPLLVVTFRWSSSDPAVVRVEEDPVIAGSAQLIGIGPGSASVEVRAGGQRRSVQVTVVSTGGPVGAGQATVLEVDPPQVFLLQAEELQLTPRFLKDDGSAAAPVPITWRSYNQQVATVGSDGKIVGVTEGATLVEANAPGLPPRRITVQVATAEWRFASEVISLSPARADTLRAVVPSQGNRPLNPRLLSWRSGNPNVVVVSPLGVALGVSAGQAEVTAFGLGTQNSVPVRVHRPVEVLAVGPVRDTVFVPMGGTTAFTARAFAADDSPIPEAPILWEVGDTTILGFDRSASTARGLKIGTTTLRVRTPDPAVPSKTWTTVVVATGLALDVKRAAMSRGDRLQLSAFFADSAGNRLAPASGVNWSSTDAAVAAVDGQGMVIPADFGTAQIVAATPWGNADTATVYVQGEMLVVSSRSGTFDIYSLDRSEPDRLNPVVTGPGRKLWPRYSPDGTGIAYVTDRDGNFEVYVADADGTNPRRLTTTAGAEGAPQWSPDGAYIYYESDAALGAVNVWRMNADGSDQRNLTQGVGTARNEHPAVKPDGSQLAFVSTRDGNYEIYLMNPDGTNERNFTGSPANETAPAWVGDGAIAFLRETREGREIRRVVLSMDFQRQTRELLAPGLPVVGFALSAAADLLAVVATAPSPTGQTASRLYLIPLTEGGTPREVPSGGEHDQFLTPSFRPAKGR